VPDINGLLAVEADAAKAPHKICRVVEEEVQLGRDPHPREVTLQQHHKLSGAGGKAPLLCCRNDGFPVQCPPQHTPQRPGFLVRGDASVRQQSHELLLNAAAPLRNDVAVAATKISTVVGNRMHTELLSQHISQCVGKLHPIHGAPRDDDALHGKSQLAAVDSNCQVDRYPHNLPGVDDQNGGEVNQRRLVHSSLASDCMSRCVLAQNLKTWGGRSRRVLPRKVPHRPKRLVKHKLRLAGHPRTQTLDAGEGRVWPVVAE